MSRKQFIFKSVTRPKSFIFGWGMCGFGLLAGIGMSCQSFIFNDEMTAKVKMIMTGATILGFMIGGITWGAVMWVLVGRKLKDRIANQRVDRTR